MFSLKEFFAENKQSLKEFSSNAHKYCMYAYMWTSPLLFLIFTKGWTKGFPLVSDVFFHD